uniref:Uncharacterized protein n=1 Tax=Aegilops tauschii subsp. strangulata TaxID=200361 RepID=A0A453P1J4_AEGTS
MEPGVSELKSPSAHLKNFKLHCCHCLCNTACSGEVDCRIRMLDAAVLFSRLL